MIPATQGPTARASMPVMGIFVALIGWGHLASPWGPDFRQATADRQARSSLASHGSHRGGDERRRLEARLRRALLGNGYRLMRTRLRHAPPDLGGYLVLEFDSGRVVVGGEPRPFAARLDEVEAWCRREGLARDNG
ncbi:hypothetical protein QWZ14_10680 [Paeniroseomonas aquatica]|uniref:Uncharacterized protein n=1 Tax=Paeniroseomonas aquatica TaxID=373043 RepID=A0ABT8A566_9PROT|nr:hypothetical protein [Paeniroseomonas aquatica]MDN3564831.1 hypothetical protein [Paeniroseomonas aquatica]